ncbi:MAG TPA: SDR family oxidoreductase [Actinomycetota bacterium]|jgi:2-deoxy-D-gluconate 3-dehydrogenase|nr:SDR family oxidoreductase [Actinomycetota bacterium]
MKTFSLEGRVALVTGGNGGLGMGYAHALRESGARVAITGRDPEKNRAVAEKLGSDALVLPVDVRDEGAVEDAVAAVADRFGAIDVLVNNAGSFHGGSVLELSRQGWEQVIATHLTGSFLCAKHAARQMVRRGEGGKIVNVGSMYSLFGPPGFSDYAAAKTGIMGLTRALAVELAPHGIQVNAILPGWFETDLTRGGPRQPWGEAIRRKTPAGRWGEVEDLAGTLVFLSSSASDFVTGVAIPVDGGYSVADRFREE